ncbi:hypothetical protein GOBAR_DD10420 [Gossypium barbadense]|nr:hypothetical protein GOBAR_DD10420 [Gossypium barbadense]
MVAGAKEIGISPSIVGYFPRKAAALVYVIYFDFDYYLFKLDLLSSLKFLYRAASTRIELLVSYVSHCWMRALLPVSMFRFPPISDNDNIFLFLDLPFFMDACLQRLIDRIDSKEESHHFIPSQRISKLVRVRLQMQAPYILKWPQAHPFNVPASFKQRAILVDEIWRTTRDEDSDINLYVKRTVLGGIYSTTEIYMLTDHSPEAVRAGMGSSLQGFVGKVLER